MSRCSFWCQRLNSHSDGGKGSRLLTFFIFKRNAPPDRLFWLLCGRVVSQMVKLGTKFRSSPRFFGGRSPFSVIYQVALRVLGFVFSGVLQVHQGRFCSATLGSSNFGL